MRALDLACRALGEAAIHSLSRSRARWRASSSRPSCARRFCFCSSQDGVVALVGDAAAAVELQDPAGDVVEEVAVMGDDQDRARIAAQVAFQPGDGLGVEMVGGLVEQQQLGLRPAAAGTAPRGGARRRRACRRPRRPAGSAGRPSPGRPWLSRSHRFLASISSCSARHLVRGLVGVVHGELVVAVEDRLLWRRRRSMTFSRTVLAGSSCGSCGR